MDYTQNNAVPDFHPKDKQWAFGETLEWYLVLSLPLAILCVMYFFSWG